MVSSKSRVLSFGVLLISFLNCANCAKVGSESISEAVVGGEATDTALMGKIFPVVSQLFRRKGGLHFGQVFRHVTDALHEGELAIFAIFGWGLVPVTQFFYEMCAKATLERMAEDDERAEAVVELMESKSYLRETYEAITPWNDEKVNDRIHEMRDEKKPPSSEFARGMILPFRNTRLFHVVDHISQASKIGLSVIAVDCIALAARKLGYNPWGIMERLSRIFSKVVTTGWIASRFKLLKRFFLEKLMPGDLGKLQVFDQIADGLIFLGWMFSMLNYLEVQTGIAVMSLFSIGATGTLIFGLASKDIASQLLSGILLHLSDKMFEGDDVRFSDGTSGRIEKMGWFETMIRNSDELVVSVPNSALSGQRVYNLSRTPKSQVQQTLRVRYDDAHKIHKFLDAIKEEIQKLPKLITDGSRPFRAHWRNYEDDHLQIVVDCHFTIKPTGDEYFDNRQKVLEAIFQAATKTGVHFEIRADK